MAAIFVDSDSDKIWNLGFAHCLVNRFVLVRKKGKGNLVFFLEMLHFVGSVLDTNADQLDFLLEIFPFLDSSVQFVHPERFFLANGSVHAEQLHYNNPCLYLGDCELPTFRKAEIAPGCKILRRNQLKRW